MNIEIHQKDDRTSWEELTKLFHEAFQERLDQGLHFSCSYFTPEELKPGYYGLVVYGDASKKHIVFQAACLVVKETSDVID